MGKDRGAIDIISVIRLAPKYLAMPSFGSGFLQGIGKLPDAGRNARHVNVTVFVHPMPPMPERPAATIRAKSILCVDDEPAMRSVIENILRRENWIVETAANGLEAWEKLNGNFDRYDVVMTDSRMPKLDGLSLVERLSQEKFPGRIVVFSSTLSADSIARFQAFGVAAILEKAVARLDDVLAAVRGEPSPP